MPASAFPDSEHPGTTLGAYALGCGLTILQGDLLGIFDFPFGTALDTICFHVATPLLG